MRAQKVSQKGFDFYFPSLDNMVLVECDEDGTVTIRAARDNFSEQRKAHFIRQLAAEGFIPDMYQFFSGSASGYRGIRWIIDHSWLKIHPDVTRRANRFMRRALISATALWL